MIDITKDKLIISIQTDDPESCLENLRDAVFNALKHMSRAGGETNPDPEGLNVYLLELLEETSKGFVMSPLDIDVKTSQKPT